MKNKNFKFRFLCLFFLFIIAACTKDEPEEEKKPINLNNLTLGASANDLLSDKKYTSMRIEIVYVEGYEPTKTALSNLKSFLQQHVNKPDGINFTKRAINSPDDGDLSISEIVEIEKANRTYSNTEDEIAVFILFTDGKSASAKDENYILGTAYKNTSMVVFEKTIQKLASESGFIPRSEIESATLMHEFGHLFGLVDNGSPAQSDHEDQDHKAHCNSEGCLMVSSVEFGMKAVKILKSKSKGSALQFDEKCLADLRANGGK